MYWREEHQGWDVGRATDVCLNDVTGGCLWINESLPSEPLAFAAQVMRHTGEWSLIGPRSAFEEAVGEPAASYNLCDLRESYLYDQIDLVSARQVKASAIAATEAKECAQREKQEVYNSLIKEREDVMRTLRSITESMETTMGEMKALEPVVQNARANKRAREDAYTELERELRPRLNSHCVFQAQATCVRLHSLLTTGRVCALTGWWVCHRWSNRDSPIRESTGELLWAWLNLLLLKRTRVYSQIAWLCLA